MGQYKPARIYLSFPAADAAVFPAQSLIQQPVAAGNRFHYHPLMVFNKLWNEFSRTEVLEEDLLYASNSQGTFDLPKS